MKILEYTRLNLGCGWDIRPGFLNVDLHDFHHPDMVADILDLKELPSDHFEEIVAQDVLEHIERVKQVPALTEWARLLSPTGRLFLRLPSLFDMLKLGLHPSWHSVEQHTHLINMVYGTQAYSGDYHLAGHTALTLTDAGKQAGLLISSASIRDGWLFDVVFRKVADPSELTDEEFIHNVYFTILARPVDSVGLEYGVTALKRSDRQSFVKSIENSAESRNLRG